MRKSLFRAVSFAVSALANGQIRRWEDAKMRERRELARLVTFHAPKIPCSCQLAIKPRENG